MTPPQHIRIIDGFMMLTYPYPCLGADTEIVHSLGRPNPHVHVAEVERALVLQTRGLGSNPSAIKVLLDFRKIFYIS